MHTFAWAFAARLVLYIHPQTHALPASHHGPQSVRQRNAIRTPFRWRPIVARCFYILCRMRLLIWVSTVCSYSECIYLVNILVKWAWSFEKKPCVLHFSLIIIPFVTVVRYVFWIYIVWLNDYILKNMREREREKETDRQAIFIFFALSTWKWINKLIYYLVFPPAPKEGMVMFPGKGHFKRATSG